MNDIKELLRISIELLCNEEISAPLGWHAKRDGFIKRVNKLLEKTK